MVPANPKAPMFGVESSVPVRTSLRSVSLITKMPRALEKLVRSSGFRKLILQLEKYSAVVDEGTVVGKSERPLHKILVS